MIIKTVWRGCVLLLLLLSVPAMAAREVIEWQNQNGQIFIAKATYTQATFNMPMCTMSGLRECRLFFVSYAVGAPAVGSGITIASGTKLTDIQYATALQTFTGKLLALPADQGLCIWKYEKGSGSNASMDRYNCDSGGIKPTEPVLPTCTAIGGPVEINYGDIQAKDVPGLKKTKDLIVSCDAKGTLKVSIIGYTASSGLKLRADGSLVSDILVREQPGNIGSLENVSANQPVYVPISSILKVNGDLAGGAFQGSATINMEIY
ncbi:MrpH family fimbial adhesin [Serratia fonticola]|jgi:hypothetical protein|uniref:MrpH family fimbial adhesin n=1 Tax=Serratia fonticola TaxID=47917 RepID=UPI00217A4B74|nr:hypothetical protein [Serratia fonticola]CAI1009760.1 Uncharacterised protein [Serratia fonticola]CAI1010876.1 Uncharacterised protein [Serratia fonticola]CAI1612526.1 Uncharacterised protein [Serratia fonticola]CAI1740579.1 Uncharacterised protein [Serratia fonticola]CAI1785739.1 Uncharacterised protein [Serratia fonticola]